MNGENHGCAGYFQSRELKSSFKIAEGKQMDGSNIAHFLCYNEAMKDIAGFEGLYAITKEGEVWVYPRTYFSGAARKSKKLTGNKFLKQTSDFYGYLAVGLSKGGKVSTRKVHRLVAQAFIPNPSNLPQVNHKDCNKKNNHISNLEWVTDKENKAHSIKNGTFQMGDRHHMRVRKLKRLALL